MSEASLYTSTRPFYWWTGRDRERHRKYYLKHEDLVYHYGLASHDGGLQGSSCHIAHSYAKKYDTRNVNNTML